MTRARLSSIAVLFAVSILAAGAQGVDPGGWATYNGDYSGRRFSPLKQIDASNVHALTLAWLYRISDVSPQRGVGEPTIKSTPLMVNGVLYFTIPDHVYALDARTGEQIWHVHVGRQGRPPGRAARCRHLPRLPLFPGTRRLVHLAEREGREGALAQEGRRRETAVLHHERGARRPEPRDHRRRRRRHGRPRLSRVARSRDGRPSVALVHHTGEEGGAGIGDLARR